MRGVVAVAAIAAGPAAADHLSAYTGLFGSGLEDGTGEMIDLGAPDVAAVWRTLLGVHPLPPGGSWDDFLASEQRNGRNTLMSQSVMAQQVAYEALASERRRGWTAYPVPRR